MCVASFSPFQTTYYLSGHSFLAQELNRQGVAFRQHDNPFLSVAAPQALQAAADRFTPERIRERQEYWTLVLGPKFSRRERQGVAPVRIGDRFISDSCVGFWCRNPSHGSWRP
jgi:hypothetical protein